MGMTLTEKILARAAGQESVAAGEIIRVAVDLVFAQQHVIPGVRLAVQIRPSAAGGAR